MDNLNGKKREFDRTKRRHYSHQMTSGVVERHERLARGVAAACDLFFLKRGLKCKHGVGMVRRQKADKEATAVPSFEERLQRIVARGGK
jgi:hypothetical protein